MKLFEYTEPNFNLQINGEKQSMITILEKLKTIVHTLEYNLDIIEDDGDNIIVIEKF